MHLLQVSIQIDTQVIFFLNNEAIKKNLLRGRGEVSNQMLETKHGAEPNTTPKDPKRPDKQ